MVRNWLYWWFVNVRHTQPQTKSKVFCCFCPWKNYSKTSCSNVHWPVDGLPSFRVRPVIPSCGNLPGNLYISIALHGTVVGTHQCIYVSARGRGKNLEQQMYFYVYTYIIVHTCINICNSIHITITCRSFQPGWFGKQFRRQVKCQLALDIFNSQLENNCA